MISTTLAVSATVIFVIAFLIYNKDLLAGKTKPSIVSWALFTFITLINSSSYYVMTNGDLRKCSVAFTDFTICFVTLVAVIFKGRMPKLDAFDKGAFAIGLCSVGIWAAFQSATYANVILQVANVIAFSPTYKSVYKNPEHEPALPWLLWTGAFTLNITVVIMRWAGHPEDLVSPITGLCLHCGVGLLALRSVHQDKFAAE